MANNSNLLELSTDEEFKQLTEQHKNVPVFLYFWASWAQPCVQMNDVFAEIAKKNTAHKFVKIEAEKFADISEAFEISAVPTFIIIKNGKIVERIIGENETELTNIINKNIKAASLTKSIPSSPSLDVPKLDLKTRIKELINSSPVMVFIKGTPSQPRCGFSKQIVGILNENDVKYNTFDILTDNQIREGLKGYSNWPTYPQLYINGELVGGLDIVKELVASDEFKSMIPKEKSLDERV